MEYNSCYYSICIRTYNFTKGSVYYSVYFILIIRLKERNSFWIGIFIGVVFIMSNQMLIVFGFLVSRIRYDSDSGKIADVEKALAVFSFFLAFVLAVFCLLLLKHHKDIVSAQEGIAMLLY